LGEGRRLIDGRLVEQGGEPLRLLLHPPLQVHDPGLEVLNRFGDRRALLGPQPDLLLVLHHELGGEKHAPERVLRRLAGLGRRGLLRAQGRDGEEGKGRHERHTERLHGVLQSVSTEWKGRVTRPSSGTVRNSSAPGTRSRKSLGACHRARARSIGMPRRPRPASTTVTPSAAMTAAAAAIRRARGRGDAPRRAAAASVARNGVAPATSSRRSRRNRSRRSWSSRSLIAVPPRAAVAAPSCRARSGCGPCRRRRPPLPPPRRSTGPDKTRGAGPRAGGATGSRAPPPAGACPRCAPAPPRDRAARRARRPGRRAATIAAARPGAAAQPPCAAPPRTATCGSWS